MVKRGHARGFRLVPSGNDDAFAVALEEVNGETHVIEVLSGRRLQELLPALSQAIRDSGHAKTVLTPKRKSPVVLSEDAGVRLALAVLAVKPVKRGTLRLAMLDAAHHLGSEESYYWYAKVRSGTPRYLRAFRMFLADE